MLRLYGTIPELTYCSSFSNIVDRMAHDPLADIEYGVVPVGKRGISVSGS